MGESPSIVLMSRTWKRTYRSVDYRMKRNNAGNHDSIVCKRTKELKKILHGRDRMLAKKDLAIRLTERDSHGSNG